MRSDDPQVDAEIRVGWRMAGLGFELVSEVLAGGLIGWLIDKWLDSEPKGILIGFLCGIAVGMFSLVRGGLKLNRALDAQHPTRGRGTPLTDEDFEDEDADHED